MSVSSNKGPLPPPISMSIAEIQYNLAILADAVGDEYAEVDKGFIEIFQRSISILPDSPKANLRNVKTELTATVQSIALKVDDQKQKSEIFGKNHPLVGESRDLADLAQLRLEGSVKTGMTNLSETFDMKAVAADNHCLFRSIMTGYLINKWCKLQPGERLQELKRLESMQENMSKNLDGNLPVGSPSVKETFAQVRAVLLGMGENPTIDDVDSVMNDRNSSNCLVAFSRMLASFFYMENPNPTITEEAKVYGKETDDYLIDMATMKKEQWGGNPELVALSNTLGLQIQVNDVRKVGEDDSLIDSKYLSFGPDNGDPVFDIFYFPGHYNLGIRKPQP